MAHAGGGGGGAAAGGDGAPMCAICHCPYHHDSNRLVVRLSGNRLLPVLGHEYCHDPPLRVPEPAIDAAVWPACCGRSLAAQTCRANGTASDAHYNEARVVRRLVRIINDAALAELAADPAANPLRAGFNGEGALLDLWLCWHADIAQVENYAMEGARVFSGVQVKATTILPAGTSIFNNCAGYGVQVQCLLSIEVPVAGGVEYVFMLMNGMQLERAASIGGNRTVQLSAAQRNTIMNGGWLRKRHNREVLDAAADGTELRQFNDAAVLQAFTQHLAQAAHLPEGAPGALQSFYDVSSPIHDNAITAYRAWLHLYLVWLEPRGFRFSTPNVDNTSCDILLQFPGEHVWYRGELKSWSDMRLNAGPAIRNSFIARLSPFAGRYNSSVFHFILVMHAAPPGGHPQVVVLPAELQRIFVIPMRALLANYAIEMLLPDWEDPRTGLFGMRPDRVIQDAGWPAPGPPNPSLTVTSDYYTEALAFPARSRNRRGDWAREFIVRLQPGDTLAQRMLNHLI
jgi:hypothetical protein